MVSVTRYPGTVSQTTGGKFVSFTNLNNIKNNVENSHAVSSVLIKGKSQSPNRPSTISCTSFGFTLPEGAEPTKIIVTYRHRKNNGSDYSSQYPKRVCNIGGPQITLLGVSGFSSKGVGLTTSFVTSTKTFNVTGKVTRAMVNSTKFGVKIDYPTNSTAYNGYARISYVRIKVEYKISKYGVTVKKVSGGYNGEDYIVQLNVSNKNMTDYNPTLTLVCPTGFNYKSYNGTGTITQNSARNFTWNPRLNKTVGTSSINVVFTPNVTFPSGSTSFTGEFSLTENVNGISGTHNATITTRPVSPDSEISTGEQWITNEEASVSNPEVHTVSINEEFKLNVTLDPGAYCISAFEDTSFVRYPDYTDDDFTDKVKVSWDDGTTWDDLDYHMPLEGQLDISNCTGILKCTALGQYSVIIYLVTDPTGEWDFVFTPIRYVKVDCIPDTLSTPNISVMKLNTEETDRLGDGYSYIVQSSIKHTTTDNYERDWVKNNRIGIFNNAIEENITITTEIIDGETVETITDSTNYNSLTNTELFEKAEYWGNCLKTPNTYEDLTCEFIYNENYPVYIIISGDYPECTGDRGTIKFTEPAIIDKTVYTGYEQTGSYPYPINNLISGDGNSSETAIPTLNTTPQIIAYDLPIDSDFGTNEIMSIRGIEVTGTIEQSDELVLNAKLYSPTGETGQRTIILNNTDTVVDNETGFTIGGPRDLWGFSTNELTRLDEWELGLSVSNPLLEDTGNINFGDVALIFYVQTLEQQIINIKIDGDDLSYYGAFITAVQIPEGLETDTSFLTVDGTDTNDAYRQNIREKSIEVTFNIGECDINESTNMLREITKLFVNEKDQYNRPIPKRIEFSHYSDVYFEYIMEEAFDVNIEDTEFEVKAKLTIPSGTSYKKESTTTNVSGFVQGLAAVNPIIHLKPQGNSISLKEEITSQQFNMTYPNSSWSTKIVELDCANRVVYLKTNEDDIFPVDITKYVDFNSDWFNLHGEYSFSTSNCVLMTVEFTERW